MQKHILTILFIFILQSSLIAAIWKVGPSRTYTYCSQVAPLVQDGDTIQIDFSTYVNDSQVRWAKNNLVIIGVGGRPRLQAGSVIATDAVNGKGIFVIAGNNTRVENIEFANAQVLDHNGAGIRQEGSHLTVNKCKFIDNEMGILAGNVAGSNIIIEYSEFYHNGSSANPGYQHNVYINYVESLTFRYNYSNESIAEGHELKSRANKNYILYNRIANINSDDSRTIDLPNGGTTIVMGNIIEQGPNSANNNILGYGLEGLNSTTPNKLYIVNNTFINKKPVGSFVHVATGINLLFMKNNIFAGAKTNGLVIGSAITIDSSNNVVEDNISNCGFVDAANFDYHLMSSSIAVNRGINLSTVVEGYPLQADKAYKDQSNYEIRTPLGTVDVGAYEYNITTSVADILSESPIMITPNPATDFINIEYKQWEGQEYIEIYSIDGKLVQKIKLAKNPCTIDISHITEGIYVVRSNQVDRQIMKLVITR